MITVRLLKNNRGFKITGHSGYGEQGEDIVCAAVSSAAYLTANTLIEVAGRDAEVEERDGYMKLVLHDTDGISDVIIDGFRLHVEQLTAEYPGYVIIKK